MYKIDNETKPNFNIKYPFQGEDFHPAKGLIYWFVWGEWEFDIREIRKLYSRKPTKAIDKKNIHPCTKFRMQMDEIVKLVGMEDFEKVLKKARKNYEANQSFP